jgi:hypothetical protein
MKNLLSSIGLDDGTGSISSTRVIVMLIALCWVASKFYNAHVTHTAITWDATDMGIIGSLGGIGVFKTVAENSTPKPPTSPTP